jgi:hypothetical protein
MVDAKITKRPENRPSANATRFGQRLKRRAQRQASSLSANFAGIN